MFQRILLPLDLTDRHGAVLKIAADLLQPGGEIILLHVIEAIPGLPPDELKDFYHRLEKTARDHLQRQGDALGGRTAWRSRVVVGQRIQEIVRFAAEEKCDLIAVRAPRPDPENPGVGFASLSWKIALVAPCPVLLVK